MTNKHPDAQWFEDAKFGLFLHWGIYAVNHIEASWPLIDWFPQHMPVPEYEAQAWQFRAERYNPKEWAHMAKAAGFKYVVLTTKHLDGYCLFETETTDYCAPRTGPGRDLIAPYVEALREAGLKVGLYFALLDWHDPDCATIPLEKYCSSPHPFRYEPEKFLLFHQRLFTQIRELMTNYGHIDLLWFDGAADWTADRWRSQELYTMIINHQPHIVVNNRLPGVGDYETPEQTVPLLPPAGLWETCITWNDQWGCDPNPSKYKSVRDVLQTLVVAASKGGNLLINIGPEADGTLPQVSTGYLHELAEWMEHSGISIHGSRRGPHPACFYGPMTIKGNTLYLHLFDIPRGPLKVYGINGEVIRVSLLKTGEELSYLVDKNEVGHGNYYVYKVTIELAAECCDSLNTVVAIEFKEGTDWPQW